MIKAGMKVDVNVIDLEGLTIHPPRVVAIYRRVRKGGCKTYQATSLSSYQAR